MADFPTPSASTIVALEVDGELKVITSDLELAEAIKARLARRVHLSPEHRRQLEAARTPDTRPVVLFDEGTDQRSTP